MSRTSRWIPLTRLLALVVAGAVLGTTLTVVGLAEAGKLRPAEEPAVLVALGQLVDSESKRVDLMIERGQVADAIGALEALRKRPWPKRRAGGDASVQLRHDVYGRLLRLRLDNPGVDEVDAADLLAMCDEGLGRDFEAMDANPFTARLVAIRGEILESLERDDEALLAYEMALDMNRDLLDEVLSAEEKR